MNLHCFSSLLTVQRAHVPVFLCAVTGWCWHASTFAGFTPYKCDIVWIFFFLKNSGSPKWNLGAEAAPVIFTVRPSPHYPVGNEVRGWIMLHWKYFLSLLLVRRGCHNHRVYFSPKKRIGKKNWDDSRLYTYVAGRREASLPTRVWNIGKKNWRTRGAREPVTRGWWLHPNSFFVSS